MAVSFQLIKYCTKMKRRRPVLVCIQKKYYFWLEGTRKKYLSSQKCWAERWASPYKTLLRKPPFLPPPSSGLCEKREFLVPPLLPLFKANEDQNWTHCFIRLMLSRRGSVRFWMQLISKRYLLTKIVFRNWKRCPISVIITILKSERPYL